MLRAILFDLDDTLISAYSDAPAAWAAIAREFADRLRPLPPPLIAERLHASVTGFLEDENNRRLWRLDGQATRRAVLRQAFEELSEGEIAPRLADEIADRYASYREEKMHLFDDALPVLDELRARGLSLGLITNGSAAAQRRKIERFDLGRRFDHIQIEGDAGYGKPEAQSYRDALRALGVGPQETWMVGDDLNGDIAAPQRLGIFSVWHDPEGRGLPTPAPATPDLVIRRLSDLTGHPLVGLAPLAR